MIRSVLFSCVAVVTLLTGWAGAEDAWQVTVESLTPGRRVKEVGLPWIAEGWRYRQGNDPEWADPRYDDGAWDPLPLEPLAWELPDIGWKGAGWVRLHLEVAPEARDRPLALFYFQMGAAEVYLDGEPLFALGTVGSSRDTEEAHLISAGKPMVIPVEFSGGSDHVIAIRYSNFWALDYQHLDCPAWLGIALAELDHGQNLLVRHVRAMTIFQSLFAVPLAFCLLHLFFFLYNRESRPNLQFAVFAASISALIFIPFHMPTQFDAGYFLLSFTLFKIALIVTAVSGVRFLYGIFSEAVPWFHKYVVAVGILLIVACHYFPVDYVYVFVMLAFPEMVRVVFGAIRRNLQGSRIIGVGFATFILGCTWQIMMELHLLEQQLIFPYILGILVLVLSMSVYLARVFAQTNQDLQFQLAQVRTLSDQAVEHERRSREEALARKQLEADNALKAQQLEEARKRQEILEELERTNLELRNTQAHLVQSEKMASLGNLVAGIAHEINTPVGAISSMHDTLVRAMDRLKAGLAEDRSRVSSKGNGFESLLKVISDANEVIATGTERVTRIVRSLRSFARLDEAELKRVDVHEGLENTLTLVHHDIKNRITVTRNYGDVPPVVCYPSRLNQVFLNLLVNASQAITAEGEITLATSVDEGHVYVAISDTGVGISKADMEEIFDPGFTTKGVGVGTGLGLSICYQIMQDHKGRIEVESQEGVGTTFTVVLPMDLGGNEGQ